MFGTRSRAALRWSGSVRPRRRRPPTLELFEDRAIPDATPWASFAHDAQHTGLSAVAAQDLGVVRWQTPVDLSPPSFLGIHYGSPLITQANTVLVPVKTTSGGSFRVEARSGRDGTLKWMQSTDYILPRTGGWTPSYNPALTPANRLYFPGAGGTVYYTDTPDASGTPAVGQFAFYGIDHYDHSLDGKVYINTPLTPDAGGNLYFGFIVTGANSLNLQSGIARLQPNGTGTWVSASAAAGQAGNYFATNGSAPALSNDGRTVYVALAGDRGFLVALNSTTLAPVARAGVAGITTDSSASPTVGPDGDVYFGVLASNHQRGWLLHFSDDLSQTKTPGAFGWDDTASVVPSAAVPSYHGTSTYLIMSKYNNYRQAGGDGVNKIAILDPNATMRDPITGATVMNEVLTIAGITPDPTPPAVREWCINSAAVDPITKSVLVNSEDGYLYRWDLTTNTLSERIRVAWGVGEAYTPTAIGVDGTVYAINNATLWAVQKPAGPAVADFLFSGDVFGDVSHVRVMFNEPIDPTSFTPAKIASFTGPAGPGIPVNAVTVVPGTSDMQFDVAFPTQHTLGNYVMVIGPDVRDRDGHPMDQNGNGITGEVPGDQYVLRLTIHGPRVVADSLSGPPDAYPPNRLNVVRVTFNESMDPTTFTPAKVTLVGPAGRVPVARVDPVSGSRNTQFDLILSIPATRTGTYTLTFGPDIRDPAGHQMDQNGNFVEGENPGDQYVTRFAVSGPQIVGTDLSGTYAPGQLGSIRVSFSMAMDPTTFVAGTILFLGPRGPVPVNAITPVPGTNNTQFDIRFTPLGATGRYYLWIGPNIRDTFGNALDQNGNLIPGEVPGDQYATTFSVLGTHVVSQTPNSLVTGWVSTVRVVFNLPMDPASFTPDQISLIGPQGAVPLTGVFPVSGSNYTQFDLAFEPRAAAGLYTLVVGPFIRDLYGNDMDQNGNLIPGEIPGDQYSGTLHVQGSRVTSPNAYGTLARGVSSVRVVFSQSMDPATFTPDQVASFTDPAGHPVTVTDVEPVPFSSDTQFDIFFTPAELAGTYTLVVGPDVLDVYGSAMDQNGNGIPGEIPGDQFTATFNVPAPRITAGTPSGTLHGPIASVQVTFDTPMNPDTFTPASVTRFTGPGGASIPVTGVAVIPDTNSTQFEISFSPRNDSGQYQMVVGAGVQDVFGDVTTQSYTIQFTLSDAVFVLHVGYYVPSWNDANFLITQVQVAQFVTQDLTGFDAVWVDGSVGASPVLRARAADLAAFVRRGGGLVAENETDWSWVPNAGDLAFDGQSSGDDVRLTSLGMGHPVTIGLTNAGLSNWFYSWGGYFARTGSMRVLATTTSPDQAVLLAGSFGDGRLVYSAGRPGYYQQDNVGDSRALLRQASQWTAARARGPGRRGTDLRASPADTGWRFPDAEPGTPPAGRPVEPMAYFGPVDVAASPAARRLGVEANPAETRVGSPTDLLTAVERRSPQDSVDDIFAAGLAFLADFS